MSALVFIDTNILLDFYRYPQGTAVLEILKHIDSNHDKIITGNQIEMEFKKNRQKVILDSLTSLKGPKWETLKIPVIFSEAQPSQVIGRAKNEISTQVKKLQRRAERLLKNPVNHDAVYQTLQRLFRAESSLNLTREDKVRLRLRRLAWKRFMRGYPPRKEADTSIGDAVNWEWLVECAKRANKDVVIVSRDSDYGKRYGEEAIINDWLSQEFKDRVGRRRKVILTNRLTNGFELAEIRVKESERKAEDKLIDVLASDSNSKERSIDYWMSLFVKQQEVERESKWKEILDSLIVDDTGQK